MVDKSFRKSTNSDPELQDCSSGSVDFFTEWTGVLLPTRESPSQEQLASDDVLRGRHRLTLAVLGLVRTMARFAQFALPLGFVVLVVLALQTAREPAGAGRVLLGCATAANGVTLFFVGRAWRKRRRDRGL